MAEPVSGYTPASLTMPNAQQMGNNFTKDFSNINQQSPTKQPSNFVQMKAQNDAQNAALRRQSDVRDQTNNNSSANSASGYVATPVGPEIPLDLSRINNSDASAYKLYEVGTSVNKNNDAGGEGEGTASNSFKGTPSLFNNYYLVRYHSLNDDNRKLPNRLGVAEGNEDYSGLASDPLYKNPTTSIIIKTFNGQNPESNFGYPEKIYSYSDFLYLKDYNPYGNNKLITLRRFMAPVYDECRIAVKNKDTDFRKPIAKALTYLNSDNKISDLSKMTIGINTKPVEGADTMPTSIKIDNSKIFTGNLDSSSDSTSSSEYVARALSLMSGATSESVFKNWTSDYDPWANGPLQDLVYGPINVITDTRIRDKGLSFSQYPGLTVTFNYSLKAIEKINPKTAMLDIFSNMLALTYNHAAFWGGENRFILDRGNFPLVSPEILTAALAKLSKTGGNLESIVKMSEGIGGGLKTSQDFITNLANDLKTKGSDALFEAGGVIDKAITLMADRSGVTYDLFKKILDGTGQKLTGNPTGEWHLQVGNPFAPIMMVGNLWCQSTDFEFNDELSADDFPTELKFKCTLEHGRSKDASDIQSIFNAGGGRIYYPYKSAAIDANASSSTFNSDAAFVYKPDDILGSWNRVTTDRNGLAIDSILTKGQPNVNSDNVAKHLVQTVKDYTGQ